MKVFKDGSGYTWSGFLTDEEVKKLHNEPANEELGPCECPVCRPDLHALVAGGGSRGQGEGENGLQVPAMDHS